MSKPEDYGTRIAFVDHDGSGSTKISARVIRKHVQMNMNLCLWMIDKFKHLESM